MTAGIALQPGLFQMKALNRKKLLFFFSCEAIKSSGNPKSRSVYKLVMDGSDNTHLSRKQVRILTEEKKGTCTSRRAVIWGLREEVLAMQTEVQHRSSMIYIFCSDSNNRCINGWFLVTVAYYFYHSQLGKFCKSFKIAWPLILPSLLG